MILLTLLLVILIIVIVIKINYDRFKKNNQSPLSIKTFDLKDSPYHPSVLFMKKEWNGYNYYLAETPFYCGYPHRGVLYRDRFECPSIHVSKDGLHWSEINKNPIDNLSESEIQNKDYFSDPHLVFSNIGLECWYRINRRYGDYENDNNVYLLRKISVDGINWSNREIIADLTYIGNPLGNMVVSPAIIYESKYRMWYVDSISNAQRNIAYSSWDTKEWSEKKVCSLHGPNINPWHIDVALIDNIYWLVVFDRNNLSLWKSKDGITFDFVKVILEPSNVIGSFYYNDLYRASLVKSDTSYRLYFSADDTIKTYIGVMEGVSPDRLELLSVDSKKHNTIISFIAVFTRINLNNLCSFIKRKLYLYVKKPVVNLINKK